MKGIVFNLLAEVTQREFGEDVWDQLLEKAEVSGIYTSLGSYDDADLFKIVSAASEQLQQPPDAIVQWFGRQALPLMAERYPAFFRDHTNTRSFLQTLNNIIHPEVAKLYPGAETPEFFFREEADGAFCVTYRSRRQLCAFAIGLIEGAAAYFGETVSCQHSCVRQHGGDTCEFKLLFTAREQ